MFEKEAEESYRESLCNSELNLASVTEQLEELEKEASKYALEWGDKTDGTYACCRDGYLAGAEPRERRIAELKKENAELTCQMRRNTYCYSCKNAVQRCFKKEIGCPCGKYESYNDYAKTIIKDLLSSSDEYARQRAMDFLRE